MQGIEIACKPNLALQKAAGKLRVEACKAKI